jgi:hypothetical protein
MVRDGEPAMPLAIPDTRTVAWHCDAGYEELARRAVLPLFESLAAGDRNADALLSVAFSRLVHAYLDHAIDGGAAALFTLLGRLARPPRAGTRICFVTPSTAWTALDSSKPGQVVAAFDLRPGGSPEFEPYPYMPLFDATEQIPGFDRELLPLVVKVLEGWGATLLIIHQAVPDPADIATVVAAARTQWTALLHSQSIHIPYRRTP